MKSIKWSYVLAGGVAVFLIVMAVIVISGTGMIPGDSADTAGAPADGSAAGGQLELGAWPWALFVLLGTVALGAALAYGQYRSSKATRAQERASEAGSRRVYRHEEKQG